MKKNLLILLIVILGLVGCGKKDIDVSKMEGAFIKDGFSKEVKKFDNEPAENIIFSKGELGKIEERVIIRLYKNRVYDIDINSSYPSFGNPLTPDNNYYPEYDIAKENLEKIVSMLKLGINDDELLKILPTIVEDLKNNPDASKTLDKKNYEISNFNIETTNFDSSKFISIETKENPENF